MRTAIRLCIKDFQHGWPYVALLWFIVISRAVLDVLLPLHPQLIVLNFPILSLPMWLLCALVTAIVVQADSPVGDQQFWVTRPISWRHLLAGKMLFLFCTINIPVLIVQLAALAANGLSPFHHLSVLVHEQLLLAAALAAIALLASVTRSLARFALIGLTLYALLFVLNETYPIGEVDWGSAEVLHTYFHIIPLGMVAALLLWLQYSRRTTGLTIALIYAMISIGPFLLGRLNLWHPAALCHARMVGTLQDPSPVSVVFRRSQPAPPYSGGWYLVGKDMAGLALPVQVIGIPKGHELINERINFTVFAPDGSTWGSGWTKVSGRTVLNKTSTMGPTISADGEYMMTANVKWGFYNRIRDISVRIRASLAFRLIGPPAAVALKERMSPANNSALLCGGFILASGHDQFICISPAMPPQVVDFRGQHLHFYSGSDTSIWRYYVSVFFGSAQATPSSATLNVSQEEGWFESTLDIPEIRLSDYFYQRIR